jgi:RimJ/RimL family protein N-acetyltransferase
MDKRQTLPTMNIIFETARLSLREMTLADLDFIATMLADPEVMRYYAKCYTRAEAESWIRRQLDRYAKDGHGLWLVVDRVSGEPRGQVGLCLHEVNGVQEPEIGYLIHRPFWRRSLAAEAAAGTRDYAFQHLRKPRVISLIRPENLPSQGVARKIGLTVQPGLVPHGGFPHMVFAQEAPHDHRAH